MLMRSCRPGAMARVPARAGSRVRAPRVGAVPAPPRAPGGWAVPLGAGPPVARALARARNMFSAGRRQRKNGRTPSYLLGHLPAIFLCLLAVDFLFAFTAVGAGAPSRAYGLPWLIWGLCPHAPDKKVKLS